MDLAQVIADSKEPEKHGVQDRVKLVPGNFFTGDGITAADVYMMKHILHDWNDEECVTILKNISKAAPIGSKLYNYDFLILVKWG